ncbi:MAG: hypothetical protein LUD72_12485, partial [Bacteroidales bacterium]|nr:hypothetical protein [Bacteroidales bacterium]
MANSRFTEEQKQAIANGAQRDEKTGEWYVNTLKGARVNVADLESQGVRMSDIRSGDTNTQLVDYAARTLSATETIAATTTYIGSVLGGQTLDKFLETTNAIAEITRTGFEENADEVTSTYEQVQEHNIEAAKETVANLSGIGQKMTEAYGKIAEVDGYAKSIDDLLQKRYAKELAKIDKERNEADKKVEEKLKNYNEKINTNYSNHYGPDNYGSFGIAQRESARSAVESSLDKWGKAYGYDAGMSEMSYKEKLAFYNEITKKQEEQEKKEETKPKQLQDATIASGSSVVIPSSKVTPINDGATEFAKTNPNDSAIFAKTGGPFDKLFNDIFGRIDAVYNTITPRGRGIRAQMEAVHEEQSIRALESRMASSPINSVMGGNNNTSIDFKPI